MVGFSVIRLRTGACAVGLLALAMSGGRVRAQVAAASAPVVAPISVDYPLQGSVFPPEFPAPLVMWRDPSRAASWTLEATFADGGPALRAESKGERMAVGEIDTRCLSPTNELPTLSPEQAAARTWRPPVEMWRDIKRRSVAAPVTLKITGHFEGRNVSAGQVLLQTSADPVGAPIFYRDVPLMPAETEPGVIKPLANTAVPLIAWRLRDIEQTTSRVLIEGIHSCANCHSFSRDGKTMGIDLDGPQNDKGIYALASVQPRTVIGKENLIEWSTNRGKLGGKIRVGFMSQVSPDGQRVVTMINDPGAGQEDYQRRKNPLDLMQNFYVANFKTYKFLQVFYPTRGILAWYDKAAGKLRPLPGADDTDYVHTNETWSPDGKYLVFARAKARDAYPAGARAAEVANDANETPLQYDLYRIPFRDGQGGKAEPIAGASSNGKSNSFPKISPDGRWLVYVQARNGLLMRPDSRLFIVPAAGGVAREMKCNTSLMNSWHSFSPNGRWLVFSSKSRGPYTKMFLTHIDAEGNDTPAILIENSTAANRAVNIPEFVNVPPSGFMKIEAPVTDYYRVVDIAADLLKKNDYLGAAVEWAKALDLEPNEALAHNNLGLALVETGKLDEGMAHYRRALELSPGYPEAYNNLGSALVRRRRLPEAVEQFENALKSNPDHANAHVNLGAALAQMGRVDEAMPHLERAVELLPRDPDANTNLGLALAMKGRLDTAIPYLETALEVKPGSFENHFNLGRMLAAQGRFAQAIPRFEEAAKLSGGREALILSLLSGAYGEVGRYADAAQTARRALAVTPPGDARSVEALQSRIAQYDALAK
ncbi:MAG: tetratricopeptide repeat protein [Candidatus Solibacter sp.]